MDEKALKVMVGSMGDMMAAMASVYGDAILKLCEDRVVLIAGVRWMHRVGDTPRRFCR